MFFLFLFMLISLNVDAQHGSGGAGALGEVIFMGIYFLTFLVFLFLFYININAISKSTKKTRLVINTTGLILSVILLIVQLIYLTELSSYIPLRLSFTLLSIFHLLFRLLTQETE